MAFQVFYWLTCASVCFFLLRELVQIYHHGHYYCFDVENWVEASIFVFALVYLVTLVTEPASANRWGALAVLFAWIELTMLIGNLKLNS